MGVQTLVFGHRPSRSSQVLVQAVSERGLRLAGLRAAELGIALLVGP